MNRVNIRALMTLALLTLVLVGCGATSESSSQYTTQSRRDRVEQSKVPLVERIKAAQNGTLYCPFSDECHPAVALVSVVTAAGLERCTGFLISENRILTNDHCISKSVAVEGVPNQPSNIKCNDLVFIHFAKTSKRDEAQTVSCQSIQMRSFENGVGSKDYAIITLATPVRDRKPVNLARRGFAANEKATIYRVQMDSNSQAASVPLVNAQSAPVSRSRTFDGSQNKLECQASYNTMLYPGVSSPQSPLMTFGDCAVQAGNSGSPAFNSEGNVAAIIQGYLNVKEDAAIKDELSEYLVDGSFGQVGIGTQVKCIPELDLTGTAECGSIINMTGLRPKDYLDHFAPTFDRNRLPGITENETWKTVPAPGGRDEKTYLKVPKCVDAKDPANATYPAMVMSYRRGINRFLQTEWKSSFEPNERVVNFSLSANASTVTQVDLKNSDLGTITLPVCRTTTLTKN